MELSLGAPTSTPAEARPVALKLYSDRQVLVAAFLGGPIAGGWLLAVNFGRLGRQRLVWVPLALGALGAVVMYVLGTLADAQNPHHSRTTLPVLAAIVCGAIARGVQGEPYKTNLANGGSRESWWKAVGWGLAGLLLITIVVGVLVVAGGL